jgi:hypothetical protein
MDRDRRTRTGARAPGVERQKPFERRCFSAPRPPAQNGDPTREARSTKDGGKPSGARDAPLGKALSDKPALKPYWGKPAVRNFREGNGNVGIKRSPLRAIALPDPSCGLLKSGPSSVSNGSRIRASHARKTRIASLCDCPMVLRSDKTKIENCESEVSESEAVEMEVSRPFVRNFLNHASAGARISQRCEQTLPQARPSAEGEFQ